MCERSCWVYRRKEEIEEIEKEEEKEEEKKQKSFTKVGCWKRKERVDKKLVPRAS
jgi:hypothetical protein